MRHALLAPLVLIACSSADPSPVDVTPSAPEPTIVRTPTPILSASFEDASAACNDWSASVGARAIRSVPPRSGDYACKLCGDGPSVALTRATAPLTAGRYTLTAYVRRRVGLPGPDEARVLLGGVAGEPVMLRDDAYTAATVSVDVADGAVLDAAVATTAIGDECLLVDDVLVERLGE